MIQRDDILSMEYLKKTEFTGCHQGMRYRLEQTEDPEGGKKLLVTVWPEPFNFLKTPEEKKQRAMFSFDEDGVVDAVGWMNDRLFENKKLENRLDVFLKRYNCAANGNNYSLAIERIRNDIADYKRINQEMSKQDIYRNQYEQNMSGIKFFLGKYIKGFKGEESIGETLRNLDKKLDGYYRAKSEYDNAMMIKADFESENDISMFTAQNEVDKISLEDIASDMTRIDNIIEEYAQQISQCNKQLENLHSGC